MHLLLGDGSVGIGKHGCEGGDVLEFWGEAGPDDVVRGCHAFDDIYIQNRISKIPEK